MILAKLFNWVYKKYKYLLFPKIRSIRGTTRILRVLSELGLLGVDKINTNPQNIFNKDWENLIILDACRHDLYEEVNGTTESRVFLGSDTKGFLKENFSEGNFSDIVVITANPHFSKHIFNSLVGRNVGDVFRKVYHTYMDHWDKNTNTVLPEDILEVALEAEEDYPESKKIIWFMQPHYPFIQTQLTKKGIRPDMDTEREGFSVWNKAELGEYNKDILWREYKRNLEVVMPYVEKLANSLKGKTVVTSDHGNLVGENGRYGHSLTGCDAMPLRKVPWDVRD